MPTSIQPSRAPVVASVMMSMAMIAIEATIVSTAMPQIVAQLGGLDYYSWVFAAILLTKQQRLSSSASSPICTDVGRRCWPG